MRWIYADGTIGNEFHPEYQSNATAFLPGAEFGQLPTAEIPTGIAAYIVDWQNLDAATQGSIGGQLLVFDEAAGKWQAQ
jgi:hypothetical protein